MPSPDPEHVDSLMAWSTASRGVPPHQDTSAACPAAVLHVAYGSLRCTQPPPPGRAQGGLEGYSHVTIDPGWCSWSARLLVQPVYCSSRDL